MKEFYPPIESRDTDELISMANGSTDDYQIEAIEQAKLELTHRNISFAEQKSKVGKWRKDYEKSMAKIDHKWDKQLLLNEKESYTFLKMSIIFLLSIFYLTGRLSSNDSLSTLKQQNYKKKYKQRLSLLLSGTLFWILFCWGAYQISEIQWQKEIKQTDISDWQKNRADYQKELKAQHHSLKSDSLH